MKKIRNYTLVILFGLASMSLYAEPEPRAWEYLSSTFENGEWSITEICESLGDECWRGEERPVTPN